MAHSAESDSAPSAGERLDLYLVRIGRATSRRRARELIASGRVRVNRRSSRKGQTLSPRDLVEVEYRAESAALTPNPELPLEVLFADESILIVNKPGLLPCHPLREGEIATLMNAVVARFPEAASVGPKPMEGGLVHRLDNGTSGAVMVALSHDGFTLLRSALRSGEIIRRYQALVQGRLDHALELTAPIAHDPRNRRKMIVVDDAKEAAQVGARPALTAAVPMRYAGPFTVLSVTPRSGNRHQIRAHLAWAGFPIVGDHLYGGPAMAGLASGRFFLHLEELKMPHSFSYSATQHASQTADSQLLVVQAPLPADLQAVLAELSG